MTDNQSNIGKKWSIEEDKQLLSEVNETKNYDEIALNHKRTKNAIILRVISHIIYPKFYNNTNNTNNTDNTNNTNNTNNTDNTDNDISKEYKIDIELLKRNINKIRNRSSIKPKTEKEINYNEKILEQLILLNKKIDNLIMK